MAVFRCFTVFLVLISSAAAQRTIDGFFREFTDEWMRLHTDLAARLRYFRGAEQDAVERKLAPTTTERYRKASRELASKGLKELRSFDRSRMTDKQRLHADIVAGDLELRIESEKFEDFSFPLVQNGAHAALPAMLTVGHPLNTPRDAENYVARLGEMSQRMEENLARARDLIAKKRTPPKFILQSAITQIESFLSSTPTANVLVAGFDRRMAQIKSLPADKRAELRSEAEKITQGQIYPTWRKALALLKTELPRATDEAGLWRFPGGDDAYSFYLRASTTTRMSSDEIHQTGLRLVADIEQRMDKVLRQMGHTEGTVRERASRVRENAKVFPGTEEGRAQYAAEVERLVRDAEKRGALLFDHAPKAAVVTRPYPEFMGPRAPSYNAAAPDGSRPGAYQFPVYGVPLTTFGVRTVVYHESIPGHHFQIALQMEDKNLPQFLRDGIFGSSGANAEGWGLYAERLAAEEGWYKGDLVGLLGQLDSALFRARRLVVDTGLHAKRWTRQQAIDYLGWTVAGSTVAEVERYVVMPGQACSYMIGELKIVELRERAKRELGAAFSLREFHNAVLGTGRVALDILDNEVNKWIASKKAKG